MAFDLSIVWFFVMGFLTGNGVPHFAFGAAGKTFRSPFGQRSSPKTNIMWGLSNLMAATAIGLALAALGDYGSYSLPVFFAGFWLVILMFGTRIKTFLND